MATAQYPAGPRGAPFVGHLPAFRRDPLTFLQQLAREYGPFAHVRLGPQHAVLLTDPDAIKDVLVTNHHHFSKGRALQRAKAVLGEGLLTSEGEFHLRQRRLAAPAFHRKRINAYADDMVHYGDRLRSAWQDGATLDVAQEMMHLTLAIVGKTLFNADVEGETDEVGAALTTLIQMFRTVTLPFAELLEKLPLPSTRRFFRAKAQLDATIYRIINERRRTGEDTGDLLSMLLQARDEETGQGMSDQQLRDEALTIFLAGHETTANALTWTWYLLSQNPEVEAKLHAEIDAVLDGKLPTLADLPRLRYADNVMHESMRLYPPAWIIGRAVQTPYSYGSYSFPRGTLLIMSQYVSHRNPRYFASPERFDPDRWTPEFKEQLPRFAYFPFGGGPRVCIGENFAWMEGVLALVTLAQRWRLRLVPGHPVAPQPLITLRPRYGMKMTLHQRT